ncbi:intron Large complex component GCFC2 [Genypterus blacodes]|uniref:intron Large complex component GCFC2 n=1 Tax=Genypterus blacodes TaxID=154954 RepID=UPI003F75D9D8
MFNKKPRRNFRQRKEASSDEEEEQKKTSGGGDANEEAPAVINKPLKVSHGRGISCSSKQETEPSKADSSDGEDGVDRTKLTAEGAERRRDQDGETQKSNAVLSFTDDKEVEGPEFKLKKSSDKPVLFQVRKKECQPAKTTYSTARPSAAAPLSRSPKQESGSEASPHSLHQYDSHDDEEDEEEDEEGKDDDDDDGDVGSGASSPPSSLSSNSSTAQPVFIPKAKEIAAARRRRRAARGQKEFISLRADGRSSAGSTPDRRSRDDEDSPVDEDDEPDDHERRIEFAPRLKSIRERIAEKLGSDGSMSDSSEREEQDLWEETQIGKGVKRRPGEQSPSGSESSVGSSRRDRLRQKKRSAMPETLPAVTVSMVKRRIAGKLDSLKEVHRARQAELRRMEGDVDGAQTALENLEAASSAKQLKFYRAMNLYVHNLVECMREKVVEINALELDLHSLLSDQMEALLEQRRQTVKERAAAMQQLSYSTDEQTGCSVNGTEVHGQGDAEVRSEEDVGDIPVDTQPSAEEEEQLQKKTADIVLRSQAVFSDVQDEFREVKNILSHFEEWRGCHSDSYHNAYISLCLPKLLNPIIRLQLLAWNPLKDASEDFETFPWFTALETFCHGHGYEELEHTDRQTLSNVIEKTVLPKMTAYVDLIWDPMSLHQSAGLSDLCHRLRDDYSIFQGEQSKPVKAFVEAVVSRLRSCVDEDVFIPLYPKRFLEDKSSPQFRFRDQQFWTAIKLLGNMGKWDLLLPESVLKELMLDKLLNRYLMITLLNQTLTNNSVHTCKKIADSLPDSWFREQNVCLPQLQSFSKHLVQTVQSICEQQSPEDPNTRSEVVKVLQVLSRIRCFDSIMALAEKYHYQDLIYSHQLLNQEAE